MPEPIALDPHTLRVLAAEADAEAEALARGCRCLTHRDFYGRTVARALDYRTRAIQAAAAAAPVTSDGGSL